MGGLDYRNFSPKQRRNMLDELAEVVATLRSKKNARFFLQRLLTESEIVVLARRLQIAELLVGGLTYEQIQHKLNVGVATIRGVDRWLTDAAHEYHLVREYQREVIQTAKDRRRQENLRKREHSESTLPGTLRHLMKNDSRMILFRLLLGDF